LQPFNNIYKAADNGQPTLLVSLDLSAAFDTIDHMLLLDRLQNSFGVTGPALAWLASYLTDRTQFVRIGQTSSPSLCMETGVPQGSVLGPILFSVYVSPLGHIISSHNINHQQYADDTQLYIALSSVDPHSGISQLEAALTSLNSWFSQNGLCLNPSKSEAILLGSHQRIRRFPVLTNINIAGTTVGLSNKLTTLGVTLDSTLSFNHHVSNVCKASYFHLRALRHIRPVLTKDMATSIAVALVQSRLDYANSLLYKTSSQNIKKLQRVQNTAARLVLREPHTHDSLYRLHWLPISKRIDFKLATLTYKLLTTEQPAYLRSLIQFRTPSHNTRSSDLRLLCQPRARTTIGQRAFSVASPSVYNSIPLSIRSATTIDVFKGQLKTFFFSRN
jgi:hypothetical protein